MCLLLTAVIGLANLKVITWVARVSFFPQGRQRPFVFDLAFWLFIWVCLLSVSVAIGWGNLTAKTWKPSSWVEGVECENYKMTWIHTCKDFRPIYFSSMFPRSSIHMPVSLQHNSFHNHSVGDFSDRRAGNQCRRKTSARQTLDW